MRALILALALCTATSCGLCKDTTTLGCQVLNDVVDCSAEALTANVGKFTPIVSWSIGLLLNEAIPVDWSSLVVTGVVTAAADVNCVIASVVDQINQKLQPASFPSASPLQARRAAAIKSFSEQWAKTRPRGKDGGVILYRVHRADGTTVTI